MSHPEGESLKVGFDGCLKLEFHGSKVVKSGRYTTLQMAEVAVSKDAFAEILERIGRLRCCTA